ncbi:MAG: transcription antiterminator [Erysipelotrichaceae bacterium]
MYINKRSVILFQALDKAKTSLTSDVLAEIVGVSSRTVKKDLQLLSEELRKYDIELISKQGSGYQLIIKNEAKHNELCKVMEQDSVKQYQNVPRYSYERVDYIIKKLLIVDYYIKVEDLMDELYVGRSTITNDLKGVREILLRYGLNLAHKPNKGSLITGKEIDKRQCIAEYFFHNSIESHFYVMDNIMFNSLQNQQELAHLRKILIFILQKYKIHLSELSIENLMIHIAVMMRRLTFSNYVSFEGESIDFIYGTKEYKASLEYSKQIEEVLEIDIPQAEIVYLTMHLISKHINEDINFPQLTEIDLYPIILEILNEINCNYEIDLSKDEELIHLLELHLGPMINRIKIHMVMRNPLVMESTIRYLFASQIASFFCLKLEEIYNIKIDLDEFGYLVLYFNMAINRTRFAMKKKIALVCGRGRPEMITILSQLKESLSAYSVEFTLFDTYQFDLNTLNGYCMIVSTVPISRQLSIPCITIHTFDDFEIERIKKEFKTSSLNKPKLVSLLSELCLFNNVRGTDAKTIIEQNNLLLKRQYNIDLNISWDNMGQHQLCVSSNQVGVILVDTFQEKTGLVVTILNRPISVNRSLVQVLITLCCEKKDSEYQQGLYYIISHWIRNEKMVSTFLKNRQKKVLLEQFQKILY